MITKYLEGYCRKHETTAEAAKSHAIVKEVAKYYEALENGKIKATEGITNPASIGECK